MQAERGKQRLKFDTVLSMCSIKVETRRISVRGSNQWFHNVTAPRSFFPKWRLSTARNIPCCASQVWEDIWDFSQKMSRPMGFSIRNSGWQICWELRFFAFSENHCTMLGREESRKPDSRKYFVTVSQAGCARTRMYRPLHSSHGWIFRARSICVNNISAWDAKSRVYWTCFSRQQLAPAPAVEPGSSRRSLIGGSRRVGVNTVPTLEKGLDFGSSISCSCPIVQYYPVSSASTADSVPMAVFFFWRYRDFNRSLSMIAMWFWQPRSRANVTGQINSFLSRKLLKFFG